MLKIHAAICAFLLVGAVSVAAPQPDTAAFDAVLQARARNGWTSASVTAQDPDDGVREVGRDGGVDVHGTRDDRASRAIPARC